MTIADEVRSALAGVTDQLPAGEARTGQVEMAEAVAVAIRGKRHLAVQAGTGTGKTLAYLVPAILSGQTTVVATATKNLQDQLAGKDLPFLQAHLDRPFSWAVLKGRSNYLCMQRLSELSARDGGRGAAGARRRRRARAARRAPPPGALGGDDADR